jgi:hypothetical protein
MILLLQQSVRIAMILLLLWYSTWSYTKRDRYRYSANLSFLCIMQTEDNALCDVHSADRIGFGHGEECDGRLGSPFWLLFNWRRELFPRRDNWMERAAKHSHANNNVWNCTCTLRNLSIALCLPIYAQRQLYISAYLESILPGKVRHAQLPDLAPVLLNIFTTRAISASMSTYWITPATADIAQAWITETICVIVFTHKSSHSLPTPPQSSVSETISVRVRELWLLFHIPKVSDSCLGALVLVAPP